MDQAVRAFTADSTSRLQPEPLPENLRSTQPGGGFSYSIELAWGRLRRWYLRKFRPGYVHRMAELRVGEPAGCNHEILDPRDLKYCRNQTDCHCSPNTIPSGGAIKFHWPAGGLAEVQIMGWPLLALTIFLAFHWWYAAVIPGALFLLVVSFFRDPPRRIPQGAGLLVSPADGKVVEVAQLDHDEFVGGPAVRIAIFLTLFNVHINRMPCRTRTIKLRYSPGKFLHADHPLATTQNEKHVDRPGARRTALPPHGLPPGFRHGSTTHCLRFCGLERCWIAARNLG